MRRRQRFSPWRACRHRRCARRVGSALLELTAALTLLTAGMLALSGAARQLIVRATRARDDAAAAARLESVADSLRAVPCERLIAGRTGDGAREPTLWWTTARDDRLLIVELATRYRAGLRRRAADLRLEMACAPL